jgi:isoleucyl-tRNA synthetase
MDLVRDELNVKDVVFVENTTDLITYRLLPDSQKLGPRFREGFPLVKAALESLDDPILVVRRLHADLPLQLEVDGEAFELAADEVLIVEEPRDGLAVASERGVTVAMNVELTQSLVAEGLARDVVRRVQNLRKEAGFELDDRIVATYQAEGELNEAIAVWHDYIAAETLSVALQQGQPEAAEHDAVAEDEVAGNRLRLGVRKT